jgi:hypothetical protein
VPDAPVAVDDAYATDEDTALVVDAANGVLNNDTDVDGDSLTVALVSDVSNGSLTLNADGSFSYTPNANFNGVDSFSYMANDGGLDSNEATVTITVNEVPDAAPIVINEFSASTTGTDVEYVELLGGPSSDYSTLTILEIEGDSPNTGTVDEVIAVGSTDAAGFFLANLPANALENGTLTLLLVENFTGSLGDDLDTDDDGVLDVTPWVAVIDDVAVYDGGGTDLTYSTSTLGPNYDGLSDFAPGGASRIPDGADTDTPSDWVRNDFELAGIPGNVGTPIVGEAYNTPGEPNALVPPPPPVINEFSASTTGTDVEYIEVFGQPDTDYSTLTILEIEGDSPNAGTVDEVIAVGSTNAAGFFLANLPANALENGTLTLLLVENFTGSLDDDLDTDDDGVLDVTPWTNLVDDVAVNDGGADDRTYSTSALGPNYDGLHSPACHCQTRVSSYRCTLGTPSLLTV